MEQFVKKVTNKTFDVAEVQNPALQYIWRQLESYAFDGEIVLGGEDDGYFDYTGVSSVLFKVIG